MVDNHEDRHDIKLQGDQDMVAHYRLNECHLFSSGASTLTILMSIRIPQ